MHYQAAAQSRGNSAGRRAGTLLQAFCAQHAPHAQSMQHTAAWHRKPASVSTSLMPLSAASTIKWSSASSTVSFITPAAGCNVIQGASGSCTVTHAHSQGIL